MGDDTRRQRERMVADLAHQGIVDERVLEALRKVPRHEFVGPEWQDQAYIDQPLPIGGNQTVSAPFVVAIMTQAAQTKLTDKVLEVGTGSGYQAAILAQLAGRVYTIERLERLASEASRKLKKLGYKNVEVVVGDGTRGLPEHAPFDVILVTAGAAYEPPQPLLDQLRVGGRLVIPVGDRWVQTLYRYTKLHDGAIVKEIASDWQVVFVPLVGEYGWGERNSS